MDAVTLNCNEVLSFVGWSESNYRKNGQKGVFNKLTDMGMTDISINGRGKKATYTFNIPDTFWRMLMVDKYSAVNTDCMNAIINGSVTSDGLVLFDRQIIEEISAKHEKEYDAVNSAFKRIKNHLSECGLIVKGKKSHRVKFKEGDKWIDGPLALKKNEEAKELWKKFYANCLKTYKKTDPTANYVPQFLLKDFQASYINEMKRLMNVYAYKTARQTIIDDRIFRDIDWARTTFLNTNDMAIVRSEIEVRQMAYRQEKTAPMQAETARSGLSKEQRKQAYRDLKRAFEGNLI